MQVERCQNDFYIFILIYLYLIAGGYLQILFQKLHQHWEAICKFGNYPAAMRRIVRLAC